MVILYWLDGILLYSGGNRYFGYSFVQFHYPVAGFVASIRAVILAGLPKALRYSDVHAYWNTLYKADFPESFDITYIFSDDM